jgi:hypothetical protein
MRALSFQRLLVLATATVALLLAGTTPSAADITATVNSQGNLTIKGDGGDDDIAVAPGGMAGEVDITANSSINGGGSAATMSGVTGNIRIKLAAGDDLLVMEDFTGGSIIAGKLTIACGPGDDVVDMLDAGAQGGFKVTGGPGVDTLSVSSATFGDKIRISGGKGVDEILLDSLIVTGKVRLAGGNDGDNIFIGFTTFSASVNVAAGAGDDTVTTDSSDYGDVSLFNGGKGAGDDFEDAGGNAFTANTTKNFEL